MQLHLHQIVKIQIKETVESQWMKGTGWRDILLTDEKGNTFQVSAYGDIENLQIQGEIK